MSRLIVANLQNTKTNRFHPIYFVEKALPGNPEMNSVRAKSAGHHTVGFDTREEAIASCQELAKKLNTNNLCLEKDFAWDGEPDTAAMVLLFIEQDGKFQPLGG